MGANQQVPNALQPWKLPLAMAALPNPGPQVNGSNVLVEVQLLAVKVAEIGQTICPECDGYGHTRKQCGTYKRLIKLAQGVPVWRMVLNQSRERSNFSNRATMLGKRLRWS